MSRIFSQENSPQNQIQNQKDEGKDLTKLIGGFPNIEKIDQKFSEEDPHSFPKDIQCRQFQDFQDNFDNLLKSDDEDCEDNYQQNKEESCSSACNIEKKKKNMQYDPSISNISSMSTFNITSDGDNSSPFGSNFKEQSVKSEASSFQYKIHQPFKSSSDIDTASNLSSGPIRNDSPYCDASFNSFSSSKPGYFPPFGQDFIEKRKKTYHPGFTSKQKEPFDFGQQGNHSIQYLQAQQNQVFDQGLQIRKKSNTLFTPHFYQMHQQNMNFRMQNSVMIPSQEQLIFSIQKKLQDLEQSVQGFGDDQQSCRFLQDILETNDTKLQNLIKDKVISNFKKLMAQKFGNYLCQKIIQISNATEILAIIQNVTKQIKIVHVPQIEDNLISISTNNFGTRAVQKLIEVLYKYPLGISRFQKAINEEKLIHLIKDNHGNHVVQQCLAKFPTTMTIFIFATIIPNCIELAQHRQGCCVVQKCLEFGYQEDRLKLIAKLITYCQTLIPDQYGNYVLQHIIEKKLATEDQLNRIFNFVIPNLHQLAKKKFSSNFVEKCLVNSSPDRKQKLFSIICDDRISKDLLLDKYGNYVFQTALTVTTGKFYQKLKNTALKFMNQLKRKDFGRPVCTKLAKTLDLHESYFLPQQQHHQSSKDLSFKKWQPKGQYYYCPQFKCKKEGVGGGDNGKFANLDSADLFQTNWKDDQINAYQGERRHKTTCPALEHHQYYHKKQNLNGNQF